MRYVVLVIMMLSSSCFVFMPERILIVNDTGEEVSLKIVSEHGFTKVVESLGPDDSISISRSDDFPYLDEYTLTWKFKDGQTRVASVDLSVLARANRREFIENSKRYRRYEPGVNKGHYGFLLKLTRSNYIKDEIDHAYYSN